MDRLSRPRTTKPTGISSRGHWRTFADGPLKFFTYSSDRFGLERRRRIAFRHCQVSMRACAAGERAWCHARAGPIFGPAQMQRCCQISAQIFRRLQRLSFRISSARTQSARFRLTPRSMLATSRVRMRRPCVLRPGWPPRIAFSWTRLEGLPEAAPEVLGPARLDQLLDRDRRRRLALASARRSAAPAPRSRRRAPRPRPA